MNLPRYPKYKPSGVDWLGEVPEHWEASRVGYVANKVGSGKTPRGGADNYRDEGVMLIRSQNVYDDGLRLDDVVFVDDEVDEDMAGTRVAAGDVLLNITGASIGRCALVPSPFVPANVNQHVCIVRPQRTKIRQAFLQNLLVSSLVKSQVLALENGSSREGLNFQQVRALSITLPPLPEQRAIADFLDRETGRIDALVGKKRVLIARLKEKRAALITRAVTRGLDPAAKLKDSGVEWLGMVPEGWEVKRVKHMAASLEQGWSPQCESYPVDGPDEWGVLKVGCVNGGAFTPGENKRLPPELEPVPELGIREGDLLISRANTRDLVGSAAVASENYPNLMLCDKLYRLRLRSRLCTPRFLADYLGIRMVRGQIELDASGASDSMQNIGQSTILELAIALPPLAEQRAIAKYLDRETGKLDRLTERIEAAIERLHEYRAALITAAVTGKIDVRGTQAKEAA